MMQNLLFGRVAVLAAAALLLSACGGAENIAEPTPLQPIEAPAVRPTVQWNVSGGDGAHGRASGLRPDTDGGTVYVANNDGNVAAFNIHNGKRLWHTNTEYRLVSGPTVAGNTLLVGSRKGLLLALAADDGELLWQARASSEVLAAPASGRGIVVVRTLDSRLEAYDLDNGDRLWTVEHNVPDLTMRGAAVPQIRGTTVLAGLDNGDVVAMALDSGRRLWEQAITLPTGRTDLERMVDVDADLLLDGDALYAISVGGKQAALTADGRVQWKQDVASSTGLAADRQHIYTTDLNGVVHAVNRASGSVDWSQNGLKYRRLSAPVVYHGYVVVGDFAGYLHWLDPATGALVGRLNVLGEAIPANP